MGADDRRDGRQQRDLFTTREGHEGRRERGDDLRYDGPLIGGGDDQDVDDGATDEGSGSGKAFFTAALVGGIVILLVGAALWFRSSTDEMISAEENARLAAATDATAIGAEPVQAERDEPPPSLPPPAATPPEPSDYRPLPERPPIGSESASTVAESAPPAAGTPRDPEPSVPARPAPAEASLRREGTEGASVRALVEAGRLEDAANVGQQAAVAAPWSLQVLLACDPNNVRRAFQGSPSGPLNLVRAEVDGRACWRLLYGAYPDRASAVAGIESVPDYFRQSGTPRPYATR
ncbi:MAG: hypothetical protein MUC67_13545 [Acidobacteria bacterium]|jgi:hypothetical protein|nr:hypothetical protein [Acidobacteriota bacterium]